jgi:hypothetical protein
MRDVFFHTQSCATLAMVAVQWPEFICEYVFPILICSGSSFLMRDQTPFSRKRHGQPFLTVRVVNSRVILRRSDFSPKRCHADSGYRPLLEALEPCLDSSI